jgi:hypothetical protein
MIASTVEKDSYSQLNPHEFFLYMYTMMLQRYYCFAPFFADQTLKIKIKIGSFLQDHQ